MQVDAESGLWSVHNFLSLLLLSSHIVSLLQCVVGVEGILPRDFQVLQELLKNGFFSQSSVHQDPAWIPHSPQVLPENLLLHWLLSTGCSFCQELAPVGGLYGLQCGFLHHRGPPWAEGMVFSPRFFPQAAGESLLSFLEHLILASFTDLHVCWGTSLIFYHYTFSQPLCSIFQPFKNMLLKRHHQYR